MSPSDWSEQKEDTEEERIAAFLPRLRDELTLLGDRESYRDPAQPFAHWAMRQLAAQLPNWAIRASVLESGGGSKSTSAWVDEGIRGERSEPSRRACVARFRWAENAPISARQIEGMVEELTDLLRKFSEFPPSRLSGPLAVATAESVKTGGLPLRGIVVVDAPLSTDQQERLEVAIDKLSADLPDGWRIDVVDLKHLYDLYLLRLDTHELPVPESVQLRLVGKPSEIVGVPGRALTVQIPISEIYRIVRDHQLALFSKNLRVPISRSKYNRRIQEVLGNEFERKNFWLYNNGITALCDGFELGPRATGVPETVVARHPQIVNGCQTSMTIYNEGCKVLTEGKPIETLDTATVLVRLIELSGVDHERSVLSQKIARYTNSQTPITGRDLHATDPIQARFRDEMNREWRIFFETKKEEWKRRAEQNKSLKHNFMWPYMVRNDDAAQYFIAIWLQRPSFAKNHKKEIFEDDEVYDEVFGLRISSEAMLIPVFLSYLMEEWRLKRGLVKRHRGEGSAHTFSRDKVFAHGDFYLLAMVGASLKARLGLSNVDEADVLELRRIAKNLRTINTAYGGPFQGSLRKLSQSIQSAFDGALSNLYRYCDDSRQSDPETDIRTILVRDSTWVDLEKRCGTPIADLLQASRSLLSLEV